MQLTPFEQEAVKVFWKENGALNKAELLAGAEKMTGRRWSMSTIHRVVEGLLYKGLIDIEDTTVTLGRKFRPIMSYSEWVRTVMQDCMMELSEPEILSVVIGCFRLERRQGVQKDDPVYEGLSGRHGGKSLKRSGQPMTLVLQFIRL